MEIIEPNPILIEYWNIANSIDCNSDGSKQEFIDSGEWHYIPSNLEKNIFLLKRLDEVGLLPDVVNICDCGVGLGTTLFDIYLQSMDFQDKRFSFTGIEKWPSYVSILRNRLFHFWEGNLNLIQDDIVNQNYSQWNFIWFFQPFKVSDKAMKFYFKVISESQSGTLIFGLDTFNIMTYGEKCPGLIDIFSQLKLHKLDDSVFFQKI